jgi:hypothetical protein
VNDRPKRPTLFCTKNTGPREESFIKIANSGISQLNINKITIAEITMSITRLDAK